MVPTSPLISDVNEVFQLLCTIHLLSLAMYFMLQIERPLPIYIFERLD